MSNAESAWDINGNSVTLVAPGAIYLQSSSYLFPAMGASPGHGSFSPTAAGYDLRIEPVVSLPRWLCVNEYPRRGKRTNDPWPLRAPLRKRRYAV